MAATIEKLTDKDKPFMIEQKGKYYSTPFGRMYVSVIPEQLKSPELTAQMEWQLRQIRNGELHKDDVISKLNDELMAAINCSDFQKKNFERCFKISKPSRANYKKQRVNRWQ